MGLAAEDHQASIDTVENLIKMIGKKENMLTHIALNGMEITEEPLLKLCGEMAKSKRLTGIHMNDNGIGINLELFDKVINCFKLKLSDIS